MRFVLANRLMDRAGGTEIHLLTLGSQLQRLGHEAIIYSPQLGPFADYVRNCGLEVADQLRELPEACDVVLAQDAIVAYECRTRYPEALHVFRICGDVYDFQQPPQLDGLCDLIVVLSDRYERLAAAGPVRCPVIRLRVPIDVDRLAPVGGISPLPRRAVLLGNYQSRFQLIRDAWEPHGLQVSLVGGVEQRYDIPAAMAEADIVVAKGRAALDAMACGRAVYVFDVFGGDGWVTPARYPALEADNFAGLAVERVIGARELECDLADYEQRMGIANRDLVLQHHDARQHAIEFLAALSERRPGERPPTPLRELSRLTALGWSWQQSALETKQVARDLHAGLLAAQEAAARAEAELRRQHADALADRARSEALQRRQARIEATRAWRVVSGYWRLKQRIRRVVGRAG